MRKSKTLEEHNCCYHDCPHEGIVHIGENGGDSHWICCLHLDHWNANRARFLAGGGCEMEELGELLESEDQEIRHGGFIVLSFGDRSA